MLTPQKFHLNLGSSHVKNDHSGVYKKKRYAKNLAHYGEKYKRVTTKELTENIYFLYI